MKRRALLAGLATLGVAPPLRAAGSGRIEIEGNRFAWNGAPLRLKGIAMGDPVYIRYGRSLDDYRVVAEYWAANCVRISVHPGHWRYDATLMGQLLDADIAAARAQGLFVIVDWHAIGFPGRYEPVPPPEWGLIADAYLSSIDDAKAFWRGMAERHGGDPAVIFELWNEPVGDDQHWVSDGAWWSEFKPAWAAITAEIRAISDNIVLASGGRWAHDLTGAAADPLDDPRTAYAWHVYPNEDRHEPDRWFRSLGALAVHKPIVVTEWGFCPDCDGGLQGGIDDFAIPFTRDVLDVLGLSHTAWCYSPGAAPALLSPDGSPSDYGQFVRDYLRRLA
ncbi:cellulase family glycosylhydrolase [Devosia sp. SL43]|uniref:cellulase family glycosylhydrolase n=1 Tax=Devosia sp. SL43 TaxID=2806348 RepID=UPI001F1A05A4|nr:cellulase family glycosylhydrolase [Devosia sp. SL43]UJW84813.1 cellulase family glycosylhydrolase [Devosia sp. SL43]